MSDAITFSLNGKDVAAAPGETIWQVAEREGVEIPHLCYLPEPGYRADGNCRACMVEIEGERVLAASCIRKPSEGMVVKTASERARKSREMVFELLMADQPDRAAAHDPQSRFWDWADRLGVATSRFPERTAIAADSSHSAIAVNLDACIHCNLCVRACREVQVNDVIGMAYRGHGAKVVFDFDQPMGESTCVACGECVQACPTGALMEAQPAGRDRCAHRVRGPRRRHPLPLLRGRLPDHGARQGRQGALRRRPRRARPTRTGSASRAASASTTSAPAPPDQAADPARRRAQGGRLEIDPANPWTHFREATWEEALDAAAAGLKTSATATGPGAGRLRLGQGLQRGGLHVPEAGAHRLRHQQRRPLHPAVPRLLGRRADGGHRLRRGHRALHRRRGRRVHHRDRRPAGAEPSGGRDLPEERRQARRQADRHGPARPGPGALRDPHAAVQAGPGRGAAQRHAPHHRRGGALRPAVRPGPHRGLRGAEGAHQGLPAGGDGRGLRHRGRDHPRGGAHLRHVARLDHLLGHGHLAARPRHRQRPLPDRAGADHRPGRPAGHRAASPARPEQRAGRLRRRPDPDGLSPTTARSRTTRSAAPSRTSGARSWTPSAA